MSELQTTVTINSVPCPLPTEESSTAATTVASLLWNVVTPEGTSIQSPILPWSYELKERFSLSLSENSISDNPTSQRESTPSRMQKSVESPLTCYTQVLTTRTPIKPGVMMSTSQGNLQPNIPKSETSSSRPMPPSTPHHIPGSRSLSTNTAMPTYRESGSTPKPSTNNSLSLPHTVAAHERLSTPQTHIATAAIAQPSVGLRANENPQHERASNQQRENREDDIVEVEGTGPRKTQRKVSALAAHYFQTIPAQGNPGTMSESQPVAEFLSSISPGLSEMLGRQASHFDVLLICIALMKLDLQSQEEEKLSRRVERTMQLRYLEKEAMNFKSQAKSLLFSHVGAGVLGVVGGFLPILGLMKGDSILNGLSGVFSSLSGKKSKDVFDGLSKMMQSISETQKASGQIYGTFAEADRTRYNRFGDIHARDQEERTRALEQLQEKFRGMERFLIDLLQMRHDVASQLYR